MNLTRLRIECARWPRSDLLGAPGYRLDPVPAGAF
jgi:hypothetical protein